MIGNDEVLVEHEFLAEAVARGAGSLGSVEREEPGLDFRDGEARYGAGELLGEDDSARWSVVELHTATGALRIRLRIGGVEVGETARGLQRGLAARGATGWGSVGPREASPSASFRAVSKLSASRASMPSRTTMRSTTTSMSCLYFLSRAGASSIG